ncbi:MAG: metalloprotease TldD [Pseudomonadota bacterium]
MRDANAALIDQLDIDRAALQRLLGETLQSANDGELFLQERQSESLSFDNGRLANASYDIGSGFGLRAVSGECVAYAHSTEFSARALRHAAASLKPVCSGFAGNAAISPQHSTASLYTQHNPLIAPDFASKIRLLEEIDAYARAKDPRVVQVQISLAAGWQRVEILRHDGWLGHDIRPMVRFGVNIIVRANGRQEQGSAGGGGRTLYERWIKPETWKTIADEALRQALVLLDAKPAPAGMMDVVLGPGWPGVMLHEAVGHGLEGDFNRKKTSAFAGLMGEQVAAKGVTVVDDGTVANSRGCINMDDEGTPSQCTVLIEDGKLVNYMQDRQNAALMGTKSTGNGRRESFSHAPMPRMTNTYMLSGTHDPQDILSSVKHGIYAVNFGGGQVDITSGKYVFQCTEAYQIENGKIGAPLKGAMLIGNGPTDLKRISMVGNDMALDKGIGTCGKNGQWVPVGVGQPTLRMDSITVGGTG